MNVKKFFANTSRDAWRMVREALGPDAVILSNRTVNGKVEILALPMSEMTSMTENSFHKEPHLTPLMPTPASPAPSQEAARSTLQPHRAFSSPPAPQAPQAQDIRQAQQHIQRPVQAQPQPQPQFQRVKQEITPPAELVSSPAPTMLSPSPFKSKMERPAAEQPKQAAAQDPIPATPKQKDALSIELAEAMNEIRTEFMTEMRSMRGMLEEQLAEIVWTGQQKRAPTKTLVLRELLAAGFSATLARYLAEKVPANETAEGAMNWARSVLSRNISVIDNESDMLDKGGVFALVGPTGVGKTTTTAKLAARCVMRHGAGKLALITTDGYRIGAYEQLRIYGKILGVMVHSVKDETDLRIALDELKNKHTILIDTVGMGQRDKMVAEQIAMLTGVSADVKRLLCLSSTSTGETLTEVVRSYLGEGLAGCIMTKLDEAATIGNVLDVVIRRKLKLFYVANGQRVPEDLHVANQNYLVDRAFKLKRETASFHFQDDELPLVVANSVRAVNEKNIKEVRLG